MYNGSHGLQFLSYLILPAFGSTDIILVLHIKWSMVKGGKRQPKMRQHESGSFDPQVIGGFFSPTALLCSPLCEDISRISESPWNALIPQYRTLHSIWMLLLWFHVLFQFVILPSIVHCFIFLDAFSWSCSWMSCSGYSWDPVTVAAPYFLSFSTYQYM